MARVPAAVVLVVALAGCGGASGDRLEADDAAALRRELSRARTAATAGDRDGATTALRAFRSGVAKLNRAERLDRALAARLRDGARQAEMRVALEVAAPAEQAPARPAKPGAAEPASRAAEPGPRAAKPGKGGGNGKGRGRKDDDDD